MIGIVTASVMQSSALEFQMTANEQFREQALHRARAVASAISADPNNFPLTSDVGQTFCDSENSSPDCSGGVTIELPPGLKNVPDGVSLNYRIERQGPLYLNALPPRFTPPIDPDRHAALFETQVVVDGSSVRQGRAAVAQGVAVVVPSGCQDEDCAVDQKVLLDVYRREPGIDEL